MDSWSPSDSRNANIALLTQPYDSHSMIHVSLPITRLGAECLQAC